MRLHNDPPIQYWNELRSALRRRHIPSYYGRELMDKLQRLQQRNMTVEEYRQKMELYMIRAGIREGERLTISRFLSGLNLDIRDRVELLPYRDLNDLVQLCIKVEQQNLRKVPRKKLSTLILITRKKPRGRKALTRANPKRNQEIGIKKRKKCLTLVLELVTSSALNVLEEDTLLLNVPLRKQ